MSIMQNWNIILPKLQTQTLKFHYAVFSRLSSNPRYFLSLFSTNSASQPSQCSKQIYPMTTISFLATLTTTSRYSGKFLIRSQVFSKSDLLACLGTESWFLFGLGLG
ncbi:hypothetical protein AAHE18_01G070300 [Arachis hypogaea]